METQPTSLLDIIPGYREALEKEREQRESPFTCLNEILCGIEVLPLSVWHMVILAGVQSPFVFGRESTITHAEQFLWILSPQYSGALRLKNLLTPWFPNVASWQLKRVKRKFGKLTRSIPMKDSEIILAIEHFVADAFQDCPGSDSTGFNPSFYSAPAAIVAELASSMHFSRAETLSLSLREYFQYQRWLRGQRDPKSLHTLINPSDSVRGNWLAQRNNN